MAGNDADALDATQEALIAIVRGLPRFDGRAAFSTWCYRVAVNACLDELRRRKRRPVPVGDDRPEPAAGGDPANQAAARIDVDRALGGLALEYRTAVVLRDLCALDYAEIAEVLEIPSGTVRSRIARGRAQLAEAIGNPDPGLPDDEHAVLQGRAPAPGTAEAVADRLDIDAALADLSPEFRAAVVLRDVCDLDYAEIAEVLDIPPGTVRSRIARGRAALAERLAGNPPAPPERPTTRS